MKRYAKIRETNEEFAQSCDMADSRDKLRIAHGIRKVIAKLGKVDPSYVNSGDTFQNDIFELPFWDSLDAVGIVLALEDEFGISIEEDVATEMMNPEFASAETTVSDIVKNWGEKIERLLTQPCEIRDGPL